MNLLYLTIGLGVGLLIGWLLANRKKEPASDNSQSIIEASVLQEKIKSATEQINQAHQQLEQERNKNTQLTAEYSKTQAINTNLEEKLLHQKKELEQLQEKFKIEFENIANRILEQKSEKFTESNKKNIGELLFPLKEKIESFNKRVEDTHKESLQNHSALRQQIIGLKELNVQMSKEANNLAKALKGDSKTQGNWGEVVLERILEQSGLQKEIHYTRETSFNTEEGRLRPDVIINLPDQKNLIIDSKVSLTAYERFMSAESDELKERFLREHVISIKNHVKQLGDKNYSQIHNIKTPDFVLLFLAVEPAFTIALQQEEDIFNFAIEKNIVLVTTSTLLATLKTVSSIWKQETYNKNADKIAEEAGKMYNKLENFVEDLQKIGKQIALSDKAYHEAMNKLSTGRGNLIKKAEDIRKLGAKGIKDNTTISLLNEDEA